MGAYDISILKLAGQGYCCTQIVVKMVLELQGRENPGLIRAAGGLCKGIGGSSVCGAYSGAACVLGLFGAKGEEHEETDERLALMLAELEEWYLKYCKERFSGHRCMDIVDNQQADPQICGGLIASCYEKALVILQENGFDPAAAYDE